MAGGATESGRTVTSKVTAILMAFSRGGTHTLTDLATLTGLPVSTTHRLAGELTARRLLERTADGGYRIGLPLRMIAGGTGAGPAAPIWDRATAVMTDLAAATGSPVRLGLFEGTAVREGRVRPGSPPSPAVLSELPAHATAVGRALLAFSPPTLVEVVLAGHEVPEGLRRSLGATRLTHVATVRGRRGGGVAMPVFGAGGALLAALELGVEDMATGLDAARAALTVATGSLSRTLATPAVPGDDQPVANHS